MIGLALDVRNARLNEIRDAIDAGGAPGYLCLYSGERPSTGGEATQLLAELTLSHPCANDAERGMLILSEMEVEKNARATGKATWGRIHTCAGTFVLDCSVGDSKSSADIRLKSVNVSEGMKVEVTHSVLTEGNG